MTTIAILMAIGCEIALVCGQLLLKRAMSNVESGFSPTRDGLKPVSTPLLAAGIGCLTIWFFLWLTLLAKWDLSRLFPFEGLNPALVVLGAAVVLKERVPPLTWIGIALISAGVAVVSSA